MTEAPSVGRTAIAAAAQDFMTDFPDRVVTMDGVSVDRACGLSLDLDRDKHGS